MTKLYLCLFLYKWYFARAAHWAKNKRC